MDFEAALKTIVLFGVSGVTLILFGLGIKVLFFRRPSKALEDEQLAGLDERLLNAEAKVNELEERLDFAERMLTEVRGKAQLPGS
jgi:hypothetical protein